jgi:Mn-dependent DtxR family transcriptional regulator
VIATVKTYDKGGAVIEKKAVLSESLEDYLETILDLEKTNKVARVKDIAEKMGVLRGSVTGALKNLAEKKLINYKCLPNGTWHGQSRHRPVGSVYRICPLLSQNR